MTETEVIVQRVEEKRCQKRENDARPRNPQDVVHNAGVHRDTEGLFYTYV